MKLRDKVLLVLMICAVFIVIYTLSQYHSQKEDIPPKGPQVFYTSKYYDNDAKDQDDMCIWIHPTNKEKSLIISSDKSANKIFVYDSKGKTVQGIDIIRPGNIDVRYNFPFQGENVDIIATTTRGQENKIVVFVITSDTMKLERMDDGLAIIDSDDRGTSRKSFGGTLYHSKKTNKYYFLKTDEDGSKAIQQYEIYDNQQGSISLKNVREWILGYSSEGAVADDESSIFYICQERKGIWKVGAEPEEATPGTMINTGEAISEVRFEGITIYKTSKETGYLIVSRQYCSSYDLYERQGDNHFIASFNIRDVASTDGIEVTNESLAESFPGGVFICHSNLAVKTGQRPIILVNWQDIAKCFSLETSSNYHVRE